MLTLERKTLDVFCKVVSVDDGTVEMYVSGIGNVDDVGDVIEPGAYVKSLGARNPKGVWAHDWSLPIAKTLEAEEVPAGDPRLPDKMKAAGIGGLRIVGQFNLATPRGRDAFEDVKFYDSEQEYSIGYVVKQAKKDKDGVRHITELDLYEWSPVLFGANPLTGGTMVKALDGKVIPGTAEEFRENLRRALLDDLEVEAYIMGTFPDAIVYMVWGDDGDMAGATYRRGYTVDADGGFAFGEAERVEVVETVVTAAARAWADSHVHGSTATDGSGVAVVLSASGTATSTNPPGNGVTTRQVVVGSDTTNEQTIEEMLEKAVTAVRLAADVFRKAGLVDEAAEADALADAATPMKVRRPEPFVKAADADDAPGTVALTQADLLLRERLKVTA